MNQSKTGAVAQALAGAVAQALAGAVVLTMCIHGFDQDLCAASAMAVAICVAGMYLPCIAHGNTILPAILIGQLGVLAMCVLNPLVACVLVSTNLFAATSLPNYYNHGCGPGSYVARARRSQLR